MFPSRNQKSDLMRPSQPGMAVSAEDEAIVGGGLVDDKFIGSPSRLDAHEEG